ncbi:MAG: F0F1 ATP synthase subunit A, partial [Anaerolineales bacterium]
MDENTPKRELEEITHEMEEREAKPTPADVSQAAAQTELGDIRKWRWGVNRWLVLLFIVLGFIAAIYYPPVLPHIQLPAEAYPGTTITLPIIGEMAWTNTMTAMVIADVLILIIVIVVRRAVRGGELVPQGFSGAIEALLEVLYNLTETTAGKWAKSIFPWFAAITLFVLIVNWMELIPGVDSIGFLHPDDHGHPVEKLTPNIWTIVEAETAVEAHHEGEEVHGLYALIPFVRVLST